MKKGLISILIIIISLIVIFAVAYNYFGNMKNEYRIGAVLALTDRGATYGNRARMGMELAVQELNKENQFKTKPIKLIVEDSRSTAKDALSAFQKLIDVDHIPVAIGFVLSDEVLTCAPVANHRKVVILTTAAGSDKIKDAGDYIFRNRESGDFQAEAIARACIEIYSFHEIGILYSTSANGVSYKNGFKIAAERLGANVISVVGYNEGKTDYHAEIEQLRSRSPKAVYLAGLDNEMGLILKQAREVGFTPQFFSSAGGVSQKLIEIAGVGAEGLVCGTAPFDANSTEPYIHHFVNSFKAKFKEDPDWISANSYDAVKMIANIFNTRGYNSDDIKLGLYATKNFLGVGGKTSFDSFGEVSKPILLVRVNGGKFLPIHK
jgi:branched-chain amino acid transport system substrate-binding protein